MASEEVKSGGEAGARTTAHVHGRRELVESCTVPEVAEKEAASLSRSDLIREGLRVSRHLKESHDNKWLAAVVMILTRRYFKATGERSGTNDEPAEFHRTANQPFTYVKSETEAERSVDSDIKESQDSNNRKKES